jgi:hypothetical protein
MIGRTGRMSIAPDTVGHRGFFFMIGGGKKPERFDRKKSATTLPSLSCPFLRVPSHNVTHPTHARAGRRGFRITGCLVWR